MSSEAYFLGAVGMINSLRLQGHDEPIYLLDLGLAAWQRELLATEATIVPGPPDTRPWLAKTIAPLAHPAETMVLIDTDVIVTRPLDELIERASSGSVVAFRDNVERFVPEWGELLDLGPIERRPYVCSAFVAVGPPIAGVVLPLLDDRQRLVDFEPSFFAGNDQDYPFVYLDQGLAVPMPFEGVRVIDEHRLRCSFEDGSEPYLLHHILPAKPWLVSIPDGVYSRLLRRLLCGSDVAVRVPTKQVPLRFRAGPVARVERRRADMAARLRWHIGIKVDRARRRAASALRGVSRASG
jgi:hypothetical protein